MKHVPSYLMPRIAPVGGATTADGTPQLDAINGTQNGSSNGSNLGGTYIPYRKNNSKQRNGKGGRFARSSKKNDPLKSFKRK